MAAEKQKHESEIEKGKTKLTELQGELAEKLLYWDYWKKHKDAPYTKMQ